MQQTSIAKPIKEKKFSNQPERTAIDKNSPALPTKQKPHAIPDENDMLNLPNLVK